MTAWDSHQRQMKWSVEQRRMMAQRVEEQWNGYQEESRLAERTGQPKAKRKQRQRWTEQTRARLPVDKEQMAAGAGMSGQEVE